MEAAKRGKKDRRERSGSNKHGAVDKMFKSLRRAMPTTTNITPDQVKGGRDKKGLGESGSESSSFQSSSLEDSILNSSIASDHVTLMREGEGWRSGIGTEEAGGKAGEAAEAGVGLEDDTLLSILSLITDGISLSLASQVCRSWRDAGSTDALWRAAFEARWGCCDDEAVESASAFGGFRAYYIRAATSRLFAWGVGAPHEGESTSSKTAPGSVMRIPTEMQVAGRVCVKEVALGLDFSCILTWGGDVMAWGDNSVGQCGLDPDEMDIVRQPVCVPLSERVAVVSCGEAHCGAVTREGRLYGWGCNGRGQLGLSPSSRGADGEIFDMQELQVPDMTGDYHYLPVRPLIELILGDAMDDFKAVACGTEHTIALTKGGAVLTWGLNQMGQCGRQGLDSIVDGLGSIASPSIIPESLGLDVVAVFAGNSHSMMLAPSGIWSFGCNSCGQLGRTTEAWVDSVPGLVDLDAALVGGVESLASGEDHCMCSTGDGALWVWGRGTQASLGLGGTLKNQTVPQQVSSLAGKKVSLVACGSSSAALVGGGLQAWGPNRNGELGHGDVSKRTVPKVVKGAKGMNIYRLAMSVSHCLAVTEWRIKPWQGAGRGRAWAGFAADTEDGGDREMKGKGRGGKGQREPDGPHRVAKKERVGARSGGRRGRGSGADDFEPGSWEEGETLASFEVVDEDEHWARAAATLSAMGLEEECGWDMGLGEGETTTKVKKREKGKKASQGRAGAAHNSNRNSNKDGEQAEFDEDFASFLVCADSVELNETEWSSRAGRILKQLQAFIEKGRSNLSFPSTLSARHRREVHLLATALDLDHESVGAGPNRHIVVSRQGMASASSSSPLSPREGFWPG